MVAEKKIPDIGSRKNKETKELDETENNINNIDKDNDKREKNIEEVKLEDVNKNSEENNNEKNDKTDKQEDVVAELMAKIENLKNEKSEIEKKFFYLAAEFENGRKRSAKELDDTRKFAVSKFAEEVVKIYDILLTAFEHSDGADKTLYDGVKMILSEFERVFEKMNIVKIKPNEGDMFDHNKHEAISRVPSDLPIGSIVQVIRAGYEIYERLLRPAMVVVSGGKQ